MDFDLQQYLETMRVERREDHESLSTKLDEGFKSVAAWQATHALEDLRAFNRIDIRLDKLDSMRGWLKWTLRASILAALGGFAALIFGK